MKKEKLFMINKKFHYKQNISYFLLSKCNIVLESGVDCFSTTHACKRLQILLEPMLAECDRNYTNSKPKFPVIQADATVKRDEKWG